MNHDKGTTDSKKRNAFFPSAEANILDIKRYNDDSDSLIPLFSRGYLRITMLDEEREGRYFFPETQEVQKKILTHQLLKYIEVIHLSSLLEESDMLE